MPRQISSALPDDSDATTTVPRATDNAQWALITAIAACVIDGETLKAALDSATQLVTVIIVLILVRTHLRPGRATTPFTNRSI